MEETRTSNAQIVYKRKQGIDLTSDERIFLLEQEVRNLKEICFNLSTNFKHHLDNHTSGEETNTAGIDDIHTSKVKYVYFIKEYQYKGITLEQFLITLDDDRKFYMNKSKDTQPKVEDGDVVSYKIDGDKLREVRVLYDI
jgi:hypothetical protein